METVLVTGARGTVGHHVVALAEAAGYRVVASDLTAAGVPVPVRGEVRPGDLRDEATRARVVRGVDHVIHTAARIDTGADAAELAAVNTDVVVGLYEAAEAAGVRRFVHMSTAMLYAPRQPQPLTEASAIAPRGPHGLSKHGAEAYLRGRSSGRGPGWTILRAAPVYGRRGRHFAAVLLAVGPILRLASPLLPRPSGGPRATLVHAEDVARALVFALRREQTVGEIYDVADDDPLPLGERLSETFRAYGLPTVPTGPMSPSLLAWLARVFAAPGAYQAADASALLLWRAVVLRHRLKAALRPRLDPEAVTLIDDDLVVDAGRLRALGWAPRFPRFSEGFRDVLRWYQAERWVPRYA
jgi:nucleoside-diphosphate-sugar epimerase